MFTKKSYRSQHSIDSLIGAGTLVEGNIRFMGGLRVDGIIKGDVSAIEEDQGTLVISEKARIEGDVCVAHLVINGVVTGSVISSELLELQPGAQVTGDVQYNTIEIRLGAVIQGRMIHRGAGDHAVELKLASSK